MVDFPAGQVSNAGRVVFGSRRTTVVRLSLSIPPREKDDDTRDPKHLEIHADVQILAFQALQNGQRVQFCTLERRAEIGTKFDWDQTVLSVSWMIWMRIE